MESLGEIARRLQSGEKGDKIKKLAASPEAKRIGSMIDSEALCRAAEKGDAAALKGMLGSLLGTPEGRRLADDVRRIMEKRD